MVIQLSTFSLLDNKKIYPTLHIADVMGSVTFECDSELTPMWRHNNASLSNSDKYVFNNNYLEITDIEINDKGYYECMGMSTFNLKFLAKGMLIVNISQIVETKVYPNSIYAKLRDEVKFKCISNSPVQWTFLHGSLQKYSTQFYNDYANTGTLKMKLRKYEDFGMYACEGSDHNTFTTFYNVAEVRLLRK